MKCGILKRRNERKQTLDTRIYPVVRIATKASLHPHCWSTYKEYCFSAIKSLPWTQSRSPWSRSSLREIAQNHKQWPKWGHVPYNLSLLFHRLPSVDLATVVLSSPRLPPPPPPHSREPPPPPHVPPHASSIDQAGIFILFSLILSIPMQTHLFSLWFSNLVNLASANIMNS